jgi:hypothetical protein
MVDSLPISRPPGDKGPQLDTDYLLHPVHVGSRHKNEKYIGELEAEPHDQPHISLGHFTRTSHLKGFVIEIAPDPEPEESIVTHITALGSEKKYELVLHVANYGIKSVTVRVWRMY